MYAYRLVKARHASTALDGEGARRVGGRWNTAGVPLAYCASSLSLAVLELLVHVQPGDLPDDLVAIQIAIPEASTAGQWLPQELPEDWRKETGKVTLQMLGDTWLKAGVTGVLQVPSVIVPTEANVLINPRHPGTARIQVVRQEPFVLDRRLL